MALFSTQRKSQVEPPMVLLYRTETIITLFLIHNCHLWKKNWLVLFPFVIVQTIGYQIQ
ncbi:hypothetical protein ERS043982_02117, partial [Streptococcus pneumoniae]